MPTPATPSIVNKWQAWSETARSNASRSIRRSRSRPTNGAFEPSRTGLATGQREQPERLDRLLLAFQLQWLDGLDLDRVAHELDGLGAEQHLARTSRLLEPRRDVDRVSGREPLRRAGDDLAGVDADPSLHADLRQRVAHLERRTDGPERVVLVQHRHAEHGHHRVADELLDRAAVRLDDPAHPLEVASEQAAHGLRIGRLAERGRPCDVAEDDGDRLPHLQRGRGGGQRRAALEAELRPVRILGPAPCAVHRLSL